jgi:hypothetical protein
MFPFLLDIACEKSYFLADMFMSLGNNACVI